MVVLFPQNGYTKSMVNNATAATVSPPDAWDDEGPTVVERWTRLPGSSLPVTSRGAYADLTNTGIRAAFRADTSATHRDVPAYTVSL